MQQNTNDKNYFNKLLQKIATDEKNAIEEFYYNYGQMIKAIVCLDGKSDIYKAISTNIS